jgi:hypothetical protein
MIKVALIALAVAMISLVITMYSLGHRSRKSLDVPLLPKHGKFFLGGSLAFFGLVLLAIALMRT